jgi:hypothetical protein
MFQKISGQVKQAMKNKSAKSVWRNLNNSGVNVINVGRDF